MPVPVHLGEGEMDDGLLTLNPMTVRPQDDALVAASIRDAVIACGGAERAGQREGEEMSGEGAAEAVFVLQDRRFEFDHVREGVLIEERPGGIDGGAVTVGVTPPPDGVEVFEREAEGVDLFVATAAIGALAMGRQHLA